NRIRVKDATGPSACARLGGTRPSSHTARARSPHGGTRRPSAPDAKRQAGFAGSCRLALGRREATSSVVNGDALFERGAAPRAVAVAGHRRLAASGTESSISLIAGCELALKLIVAVHVAGERVGVLGDRVLELAHALPQRPPHLREALRAEDEQHDHQQKQQLPGSDPASHPDSLAPIPRDDAGCPCPSFASGSKCRYRP